MTKKQVGWWLGIIGSLASIVGLYWTLKPSPPSSLQSQSSQSADIHNLAQSQTGDNNTQIGIVQGNVTINAPTPASVGRTNKSPTDQARSDLQMLGVSWSSEAFIGALSDGDVRSVDLFLKGGMKADLSIKGVSAAIYALQPKANNRVAILKLLLNNGLDPNYRLIDSKIMTSLSNQLPPHFEHKLTPPDYVDWKRQFSGPPDLWLVIRASYAGPEPVDFEQLRLLASRGAKLDVSLAFLSEYESIFGGTPAYWEVRNEVEKLARVPISHGKG